MRHLEEAMGGLTLGRIALALLVVVILVICSVPHVAAVTYLPGVKAGDYVKYANVYSAIQGPKSAPQYIRDLSNTSYFRLEIQSVKNDNITANVIQSFSNGTSDKSTKIEFSVQSGRGNQSTVPALSIPAPVFSSGLEPGNPLYDPSTTPSYDPAINSTAAGGPYAGAQRTTNGIWVWHSFSYGVWRQTVLAFDRPTGVAMFISFDFFNDTTIDSTVVHTESSYSIEATETNLWSPTILGLPLIVFYGIMGGGLIAVVAILAILLVRRRSRRLSEKEADQWNLPSS